MDGGLDCLDGEPGEGDPHGDWPGDPHGDPQVGDAFDTFDTLDAFG